MHEGTLFLWVFFGLALGFTLLLAWRSIRRAVSEPRRKWVIIMVAAAALSVWAVSTYVVSLVVLGTAWGLAHARPFPPGFFPEGWPIYGVLTAYVAVGVSLALALGRIPRRKGAV